jgi:anaerobic selenocysteine-containing dehydrogenase
VRQWVNWEDYLREEHADKPLTFQTFIAVLKELYAQYTPEFAAKEAGIDAKVIVEVAHEIAKAGSAFSSHVWRNTAAGNLAAGKWRGRCNFSSSSSAPSARPAAPRQTPPISSFQCRR